MKAGRELDALISEKVMGWTKEKRTQYRNMPGSCLCGRLEQCEVCSGPLKYSTDIAEAWAVVEQLRRNGYKIVVLASENFNKETYYLCSIRLLKRRPAVPSNQQHVEEGELLGEEIGKTAAHAICLAALMVPDRLEKLKQWEDFSG